MLNVLAACFLTCEPWQGDHPAPTMQAPHSPAKVGRACRHKTCTSPKPKQAQLQHSLPGGVCDIRLSGGQWQEAEMATTTLHHHHHLLGQPCLQPRLVAASQQQCVLKTPIKAVAPRSHGSSGAARPTNKLSGLLLPAAQCPEAQWAQWAQSVAAPIVVSNLHQPLLTPPECLVASTSKQPQNTPAALLCLHFEHSLCAAAPACTATETHARCAGRALQQTTSSSSGSLVRTRVVKNSKGRLFRIRHLQDSDLLPAAQLQVRSRVTAPCCMPSRLCVEATLDCKQLDVPPCADLTTHTLLSAHHHRQPPSTSRCLSKPLTRWPSPCSRQRC